MQVVDWRDVAPDMVDPFYAAEVRRWRDVLSWESEALWRTVESARSANLVPGWVAVDDEGRAVGWAFGHLQGGTLQLGALAGETAGTRRRLLAAVLDSPEAGAATRVECFFWPRDAGVLSAFTREHFAMGRSLYLARDCGTIPSPGGALPCRPWAWSDLADTVRVIQEAYRDSREAALLAPGGATSAWAAYLASLIQTNGCGEFLPTHSFVIERDGRLLAVALVSRLSDTTVHLPQIAVVPEARGSGLARTLLARVMQRAAEKAFRTLTLLVDEENQPARRLYAAMGFAERAAFLKGTKRLRRLTTVSRAGRAAMA